MYWYHGHLLRCVGDKGREEPAIEGRIEEDGISEEEEVETIEEGQQEPNIHLRATEELKK